MSKPFQGSCVPLFLLGKVVATPGALNALEGARQEPTEFLARHVTGDWGDLCDFDRKQNKEAVKHGERLMSVYNLDTDVKMWIITEWDRSVTTLLLPSEY